MENQPTQGAISRRTFIELGICITSGILFVDGAQRFIGRVGIVDSIIEPTEVSQRGNEESVLDCDGRRAFGFIESWFGSSAWKLSSGEVLYRFIDQIIDKK